MADGSASQESSPKVQQDGGLLSIVVFGASGDLAKKKTYPALFALYKTGRLPSNTQIVGYARSQLTDEELRKKMRTALEPKGADQNERGATSGPSVESFLETCFYIAGPYDKPEGFQKLAEKLGEFEQKQKDSPPRRLFYFALPPSSYPEVAQGVHDHTMVDESSGGWNRVVLEKPFGRDTESSEELSQALQNLFEEKQMYRIDHFLGKEIVLNLLVLRFANVIFSPLFNRENVSNVQITFKETLSTAGRAGYFDSYGIIRDIMQNHLIQVLALLAMEPPVTLSADDIRDEKTKVLRHIPPIDIKDVVIGQYTADPKDPKATPGYAEEKDVPEGSKTPTYAVCVMYINNERWAGVPFVMKAAKAVDENKQVVRIQFKDPSNGLFPDIKGSSRNELVMRLQPDEAIYIKTNVRKPGALGVEVLQTELDLSYKGRFHKPYIPQAYERLIFDVIQGDQTHFVRSDELKRAWEIFTPLLKDIEAGKLPVRKYEFGSRGPKEGDELIQSTGYMLTKNYQWQRPQC
eukprot:jgi/Chlat1/1924/Chrsp153S02237